MLFLAYADLRAFLCHLFWDLKFSAIGLGFQAGCLCLVCKISLPIFLKRSCKAGLVYPQKKLALFYHVSNFNKYFRENPAFKVLDNLNMA